MDSSYLTYTTVFGEIFNQTFKILKSTKLTCCSLLRMVTGLLVLPLHGGWIYKK